MGTCQQKAGWSRTRQVLYMASVRKGQAGGPAFVRVWADFVAEIASMPARIYAGVRKIVEDVKLEFTGEEFFEEDCGVTYPDLAFTERGKTGQLKRNYFDQTYWDKAVAKFVERKGKPHTSVGIPLRAQGKDSRSQGFCMQNLILSQTYANKKSRVTIDVFYRSTEVTQKMMADLLFFRDVIPKYLLEPCGLKVEDVDAVRFHFANAYLSGVFMSVILRMNPDGAINFLHEIEDKRFQRSACSVTAHYLRRVNVYNYMTQKKQYLYLHEKFSKAELQELRKYCLEWIHDIPEDQHMRSALP